MDDFGLLSFFGAMELDWIVGVNLDQRNCFSITRCVQHQRGMLLTHRTPFYSEVWPALIAAVIREADHE